MKRNRINTENRRDTLIRTAGMIEAFDYARVKSNNSSIGVAMEKAAIDAVLFDLECATLIEDVDAKVSKILAEAGQNA